jgi:hypothetical protein
VAFPDLDPIQASMVLRRCWVDEEVCNLAELGGISVGTESEFPS